MTPDPTLTPEGAETLTTILAHIRTTGYPPTVREIASACAIHPHAAHQRVKTLARQGYLRVAPTPRGICVLRDAAGAPVHVDLVPQEGAGQ